MIGAFTVRTTTHFERLVRKLLKGNPELYSLQLRIREILRTDPHNRTRQYRIKKLEHISVGDGQYRLALGRWRFRFDIQGKEVVLQHCGLRREDTYR